MRRSARNVPRKDYKLFAAGKPQPSEAPLVPPPPPSPPPALPRIPTPPPPATSATPPPSPSATPSPTPPPSPPTLPRGQKLSEKEELQLVKRLYLDVQFRGSFSGVKTMQREIFLAKGRHIPLDIVAKALKEIPMYLMHMRPVRNFKVASFSLTTVGECVQGIVSQLLEPSFIHQFGGTKTKPHKKTKT